MLTANTQLVFPRYLYLKSIERTISNNQFQIIIWKSDNWQKNLTLDKEALDLLMSFFQPKSIAEVVASLQLPKDEVLAICHELIDAQILQVVEEVNQEFLRYDRHFLFYDLIRAKALEVQKRISQSRVALLGVGGIGNWVASGLIGAGFKELRLLDFDTIELSNLTRQILFTEPDIGHLKVEVAAQRLRQMNSQTKVSYNSFQADGFSGIEKNLEGIDFLILSADSPKEIHNWTDTACLKLQIPYISAGYRNDTGVVGPLTVHGVTACYECFQSQQHKREEDNELAMIKAKFTQHQQAPSFGPLNAMVSSITVLEVIKYLGQFGECPSLGYEININLITLEQSLIGYRKDLNCWHCSHLN
ncbi:ThiF family adenylyltransferase [Anabaena sp. AL09]|uniref:HesA/MoeB/ThiF family protein n=1 Tax=Anabaena sp. AL09 TaxID=1710891 RepID=UPI000A963E5D|nr:ThiF family adenylyltransferase [Anabaena sp. AL09]